MNYRYRDDRAMILRDIEEVKNSLVMDKPKPTTGKLIRKYRNGKEEILAKDQPFATLQRLKKQYAATGILKKNLLITY